MTDESNAKLLRAYRSAVEAEQDVIADMIEDVILDVMDGERTSSIVIGEHNAIKPPWRVEATPTPLSVPMTYTVNTATESTSIDHTTREVTS